MPRTNLRDSVKPEMLALGTRAKIIARNTFRFTAPDGATVTRLHNTDIVRALPKGRYQLDSKGWRTVTTKDRMASAIGAAGYRLLANKGSWYVGAGELGTVPYYDGMILPDAFKHKGKAEKKEAAEQKLRLAIRKFCAKLDGLKELPVPSFGDCWLCCMKDKTGVSMGAHGDDRGHLLEHVKEGYLHGSLIVNALIHAGYKDPRIIFSMEHHDRQAGRKLHNGGNVKRALKRYLYSKGNYILDSLARFR